MGGYGGLIAETMANRAASDVARSRQLQDEQRQQTLQRNWSILNDPNSTPDMKQAAGQDIQAQYPTPAHAPTFLTDILHLRRKGQQQAAGADMSGTSPSSAPSIPETPSATDQLGIPFTGLSFPSVPTPAPNPTSPPQSMDTLRSMAQASTPQEALNLWRQYRGPAEINADIATQRAQAATHAAQSLADINNAARIQEATIRTQGNAAMQKLDAAAQSLGATSFASADPDTKIAAMKALHAANVTSSWKSVVDGDNVYAVDAHDPTKRQLIGHKNDLSQHLEYKTLTNADGSQYLVPMVTWTKKGSTQPLFQTQGDVEAPGAEGTQGTANHSPESQPPVSAATPKGPSTDLSAINQSIAQGNAASSKLNKGKPKSTRTPPGVEIPLPPNLPKGAIPFGSKGSPLLKSDSQQYTKLAEDANAKQEALQTAREASANPSPSSDQELVYAWVRSNVQGAGRMTQAEFSQAQRLGSLPQKAENWYSLASTGKLTPEMRQMMMTDIERSARTSKQSADTLRNQIENEMRPGASSSTLTPTWTAPSDAPAAPKQDGKVLKSNGQIIARSQGGKWVQP